MVQSKRSFNSADESRKKLKLSVNQTLYVQNLNDKVSTELIKTNLYLLSSNYGDVIDIILKPKSRIMRGQAHIVFSSIEEAQAAVAGLNELELFEKPMRVDFAHKKSKTITRIEQSLET